MPQFKILPTLVISRPIYGHTCDPALRATGAIDVRLCLEMLASDARAPVSGSYLMLRARLRRFACQARSMLTLRQQLSREPRLMKAGALHARISEEVFEEKSAAMHSSVVSLFGIDEFW
jgi:hypothetical protein